MNQKIKQISFYFIALFLGMQSAFALLPSANIFGKISGQDGQKSVTICSDSITYDHAQHTVTYKGNVTVLQIQGVAIQCQAGGGAFPELLSKKLPNTVLWVSGKSGDYSEISLKELAGAKKLCKAQDGCRFISGQKLIINLNPKTNKVSQIKMTVNDEKENAIYYSWPKKEKGKSQKNNEVLALGESLQYLTEKHLLEVEGHAKITQGENNFSGEKVTYDTKSKFISVPNTGGRSTMVIDNGVLEGK